MEDAAAPSYWQWLYATDVAERLTWQGGAYLELAREGQLEVWRVLCCGASTTSINQCYICSNEI
jgi:hypothetical protein